MQAKQASTAGWVVKALAIGSLALGVVNATAADFSVGRVDIKFAEDGWKEIPLPDRAQTYGGDKDGALSVQGKLYLRDSTGGTGPILVLVSSSSTGFGGGRGAYMTYSPKCHSDEQAFREGNEGFGQRFAQCLTAWPRYSSENVFKALAPEVLGLRASGDVPNLPALYTVRSRHAISTGSFLDVMVFVTSPLGAEGDAVTENLPKGVPSSHVVWGRQLKDAVKSSVYSLSGRLEMPPIRMAPPPADAAGSSN